jgi:hypothetical protein
MLNAFVVVLNVPLALPPIFNDAICGFVFTHDQAVLVTPAKSDWRFAFIVEAEVCAVGAGRLSVPPLLVKMEKVRWEIAIGSNTFGSG